MPKCPDCRGVELKLVQQCCEDLTDPDNIKQYMLSDQFYKCPKCKTEFDLEDLEED